MKTLGTILSLSAATLIGAQALAQTQSPTPAPTPPAIAPAAPPSAAVPADPIYVMPASGTQWRSSDFVGKPVYSRNDERVGEIDDLLMTTDGKIAAAVVGVGGFLGMGERKVAIAFPSIQMTKDSNGVDRLSVQVSKDMLKTAPEYKAAKAM
jgi:sporulation protein YlmC with PRC-barrel domain